MQTIKLRKEYRSIWSRLIVNKVSVYIIGYNAVEKIKACIESVLWADEVIFIDSYSTDGTTELASSLGAKIVQVPFKGFGDLRLQGVNACQHDWIFSLDTDERCTDMVRDEIFTIINSNSSKDVYLVPRRNIFMGRLIKYSGWYPNYRQPQLFRRGSLTYTNDQVHEGYKVLPGKTLGKLNYAIIQIPFRDFSEMLYKANRYSSLGVDRLEKKAIKPTMAKAVGRAAWAFFKHYVVKRGALDGWAGFAIAVGNAQGTYYRHAKLYEKQQGWAALCQQPVDRLLTLNKDLSNE